MKEETLCIHGGDEPVDCTGSLSVPIYQTATFAHPGVDRSTGYGYSRVQNPTREHLEKVVARLERGHDAMAFSSGMAAIAALMELFKIGDHLIVSDDLYGGSARLFTDINEKNGLRFDHVCTADPAVVEAHIRPETRAIFVETPTNPMMEVTDLAAVAAVAKAHGLLLIVDNTFLTPYFQKPIPLGADIVVHSGTKYLAGHNDTLAGFLVTARPELTEKLRRIYITTGACLAPFDSWLLLRGIKTLPVRMDRQQQTALRLAVWLREQPQVSRVYYVGLPDHPGYAVSLKQVTGFGAMISFSVDSAKRAAGLLEKVRLIRFAESLGGPESLMTYPCKQTHADVPAAERERLGVTDRLLRLSVGLEAVEDLIEDLAQALA